MGETTPAATEEELDYLRRRIGEIHASVDRGSSPTWTFPGPGGDPNIIETRL